VQKKCGQAALLWGPPLVPSQTSILNQRFKRAAFRISSGTSAWDAHTETALVGSLCNAYRFKEYMARTNTAGDFVDGKRR